MSSNDLTVLVGGDVIPLGRTAAAFAEGDAGAIFHDLLPEFEQADCLVVNLECVLVDKLSPMVKLGSIFSARTAAVRGLKAAGIHAVNLANNHALDHGAEGLRSTMAACRDAGIECFGAGANLAEARQMLIREVRGRRIAFLGLAEREFSIAGRGSWGASPLDAIDYCRLVRGSRGQFDCLVVLVHGGAERYPYPTPRLQRTCRFLVEEGADAVVCQHSHWAGTYEYYQGVPIVYGQGNLVADESRQEPQWYEGFLVKLRFPSTAGRPQMEIVPYHQSGDRMGVWRMGEDEAAALCREVERRSAVLSDEAEIERLWREFARARGRGVLSSLRGHGRVLWKLNERLGFAARLFSRKAVGVMLDYCRCPSNRDLLDVVLEDLLYEKHGQAVRD